MLKEILNFLEEFFEVNLLIVLFLGFGLFFINNVDLQQMIIAGLIGYLSGQLKNKKVG